MNKIVLLFLVLTSIYACNGTDYIPKPTAYPRIDLPESNYKLLESDCPFTFDYAASSIISFPETSTNYCWMNVDYPSLKCRLHLSYKLVDGNLNSLLEDSRTLVYKHTIKASAINEQSFIDLDRKVFARIYELEGDAASSVQFYATDSLQHFIRGALYFNAKTNSDSLKPSILHVREDVRHLIETLRWK